MKALDELMAAVERKSAAMPRDEIERHARAACVDVFINPCTEGKWSVNGIRSPGSGRVTERAAATG